ncbi:hypothetical protein [Streptomyces sp. NPDC003832]
MGIRTTAAALAAAALLALTACGSGGDDTGASETGTSTEESSTTPKDPTEESGTPPKDDPKDAPNEDGGDDGGEAQAATATLPDLVGLDLQAAQDEAQAAGFYLLDDQDASGQNRLQVLDRNWTVCSQEPAAGEHPTDTLITLNAVKDDESC